MEVPKGFRRVTFWEMELHWWQALFNGYPCMHIREYPLLVIAVMVDYILRRFKIKPDKWYWADMKLLLSTSMYNANGTLKTVNS